MMSRGSVSIELEFVSLFTQMLDGDFNVLCCSPGEDSVGGQGFIVLSLGPELRISVGVWWESARGVCLGGASGPGLDRVQTEYCSLCNCPRVCIWIPRLWWTLYFVGLRY